MPPSAAPVLEAIDRKWQTKARRLLAVRQNWFSPDPERPIVAMLMQQGWWDLAEAAWAQDLPIDVLNGTGTCTALKIAAQHARQDWLDRILRAGAPVEGKGTPILREALVHCLMMTYPAQAFPATVATVERLVGAGANIEAQDTLGTPLMNAMAMGWYGLVPALLSLGANPNATNSAGNTALMFAARWLGGVMGLCATPAQREAVWSGSEFAGCVSLLAAGARLDATNAKGETAAAFYMPAALRSDPARPARLPPPPWPTVAARLSQAVLEGTVMPEPTAAPHLRARM